jgi:hypothetical protein
MKREELKKLNRKANEGQPGFDRRGPTKLAKGFALDIPFFPNRFGRFTRKKVFVR